MINRLKRFINQVRFGNPFGAPYSINVIQDGGVLPPIPKYLATLGQQTLRSIDQSTGDDFDKLRQIYNYVDKYNQFVQIFSVCKRGCNHCCKIDVAVTKLEALYIEKKTGRKALRTRKHSRKHRSPCPLLSAEGTCCIYEFRPFNCRTFHTLDDPAKCSTPSVLHFVYGVESRNPPYQSGCYREMADALKSLNHKGEVKDIRDYF